MDLLFPDMTREDEAITKITQRSDNEGLQHQLSMNINNRHKLFP